MNEGEVVPLLVFPSGMKKVDSTQIKQFGYSTEKQEFIVQFLNEKAYIYKDVPANIAIDAFDAPSLGSWMHRNLKGFYRYECIDSLLNLCNHCKVGCPAECKGLQAFGNGEGNDSIFYCDVREPLDA